MMHVFQKEEEHGGDIKKSPTVNRTNSSCSMVLGYEDVVSGPLLSEDERDFINVNKEQKQQIMPHHHHRHQRMLRRYSIDSDDTRTTATTSSSSFSVYNYNDDFVDINLDRVVSDIRVLKQRNKLKNGKKVATTTTTKTNNPEQQQQQQVKIKKKRGVLKEYKEQWQNEKLPEDVLVQQDAIFKAMELQKSKKGFFSGIF